MSLYEKLSPKEKAIYDEVMRRRQTGECGVIRNYGCYSIFRHRNWYEIEYISPACNTSIGSFPAESAAIEVFEQVKEKTPAEAKNISLAYAREHFPELLKPNTH